MSSRKIPNVPLRLSRRGGGASDHAANTLGGLEYPSLSEQGTAAWLGNGTHTSDSGIGKALSKTSDFLAGIGELRKRDIPANWDAATPVIFVMRRLPRNTKLSQHIAISVLSVAVFFVLWQVAATRQWVDPLLLPSLTDIGLTAEELLADGYRQVPLWQHIVVSLARALSALPSPLRLVFR